MISIETVIQITANSVVVLFVWYVNKLLPDRLVEKIKHSNWISQQQWGSQEKIYMDLLKNLTIMAIAYHDCYYCFDHSRYDDGEKPSGEYYKNMEEKGLCALQSVRELVGPAAVFLSENTMKALHELIGEEWLAAEQSITPLDYITSIKKSTEKAYALVLAEAKRDIGKR